MKFRLLVADRIGVTEGVTLRVSPVTKIRLYSDFDAHPYYSHMSKLGNSRLSHINSSYLLIFASSTMPDHYVGTPAESAHFLISPNTQPQA